METPTDDDLVPTAVDNPYRLPLPSPGPAIDNLALARCIACENYFWIAEALTDGCDRCLPEEEDMPENLDFTPTYRPRAHEPAVYSCDVPEEFCPFCTAGDGALLKCRRCGEYKVPPVDLDDWDDPAVTRHEAEKHFAANVSNCSVRRDYGRPPNLLLLPPTACKSTIFAPASLSALSSNEISTHGHRSRTMPFGPRAENG
jgi:hypothetical protein